MSEHLPPTAGTAAPADDPLLGRLDSYFDDLHATPAPASLQRTTLTDLQASHASVAARMRTWWTTPGHGGLALAGAAATVLLVVAVLGVTRRGGTSSPQDVSSGPSSTIAAVPAPSSTTAVTTTAPAAIGGTTSVPGTDDSTPPTTAVAPTVPSTVPGAGPSTTAVGPITTPSVPTSKPKPSTTTTPSTPTTTQPGSSVLYQTDFSSTPLYTMPSDWTSVSGTWQVANTPHYLKNSAAAGIEAIASLNVGAGWGDVTIDVTVAVVDKTTALGGIAFRYQDAANFYVCKIGGQKLVLGIMHGGSFTVLREGAFAYNAGTPQSMHVRALAAGVGCGVDGGPTLTVNDTTFATGRIAAVANGGAGITNVTVRSA